MAIDLFSSTRWNGRSGPGPSFRSSQRKMLHLPLARDTSFTICPDLPRSPMDKLLDNSANLSISSGGTPKRCLDLSDLSSGEMSATQLTTSAELDETGPLDSAGLQEEQLARMNHRQDLISQATNTVFLIQENTILKVLEGQGPRNLRFPKRPGKLRVSPLSLLDNGNLVKSEMKYLGSPITTIPKLDKSPNLGEDQAEEIIDELTKFSLEEDTKGLNLKKTIFPYDINITQMLEEDSNQGHLIGDFSKVAALLLGKFQGLIEKIYIIDCQYPYEYLGGHIQGALNLYSQKELYDFFLKKPIVPEDIQKGIIIVFHCELSSEQGPRMCHFLRGEDRALNQYPALYYPEPYILKGGYRDFFPEYMELCEPQSCCPMHHQNHQADLLKCQSQSKVQEVEWQLEEQISLLAKDMSPL